ncbi:MAG: hypothetical protein JWP00_3897, partial [Chloroflexi bacterium]|nr:hypothetical protein [Chloroflexota bacterium]
IYDFWVARQAKFLRRALEVPVSLLFAVVPLFLVELSRDLGDVYRSALGLLLIPFSALALVLFVYALVALVRNLISRRQDD